MFRKKGKEGLKRLDKVVTGIIIGSVVASVYSLKKKEKQIQWERKPGFWSRIFGGWKK